MPYGDRKSERVDFERGVRVYIMGIDGSWRRKCMMIDVSQTGARLRTRSAAISSAFSPDDRLKGSVSNLARVLDNDREN